MADKMLRVAGRGEDGTAKALQTDNSGNLKALLAGANKELLTELVLASFRKDDDGLGLMRVYMENKLSASEGDSVALDGVVANQLLKKPNNQMSSVISYAEIKAKSDAAYATLDVINTNSHIILQSLHIVTSVAAPSLLVYCYKSDGSAITISLPQIAPYLSGVIDVQGTGATAILKFKNPLFAASQIDETNNVWEFTNRDNKPIEFPYGLRITARNTTETPYRISAQAIYLSIPE